jgi:hypothetical protein
VTPYILILLFVFGIGYASQRGRTCAVSAAFEIAKQKRARRFVGFLYAASWSLTVLSVASIFNAGLFVRFEAHLPTLWTVCGGVVFAAGAYINGRCSLGTIARLGSGDLSRLASLAGIFVGIYLGVTMLHPVHTAAHQPMFVSVDPAIRVVLALVALIAFAFVLRRTVPLGFGPSVWSIPRSMAIIGIINGLLIWLAQDWSYTTLFQHIARGDGHAVSFGILCFLTLIGGAITGGLLNQQFDLTIGSTRGWIKAIAGGILMGIGVILIPGGNDTMLLVGLPLLLPHLIVGYAVMYVTLIAIAWATPNR